ncbi:hypothetical protein HETIRDRAFT_174968 [Heterobasidion irregulare TC 32-1]|uniref:Uncharacterized protein n=1 Tax=Heterobasidion irregulare (strain TC 32-1) TaxID=747525 RepID=W4JVP3_HETIT|nr:uncharacterized protein HETIRDRAFT_174968 [Heterobasidion irregulare TC 32-1]ETW76931.1 hypothetical protein HETIRDRAFT_174968 [Heterobasidion irregulare TC 32-1]
MEYTPSLAIPICSSTLGDLLIAKFSKIRLRKSRKQSRCLLVPHIVSDINRSIVRDRPCILNVRLPKSVSTQILVASHDVEMLLQSLAW